MIYVDVKPLNTGKRESHGVGQAMAILTLDVNDSGGGGRAVASVVRDVGRQYLALDKKVQCAVEVEWFLAKKQRRGNRGEGVDDTEEAMDYVDWVRL